MNSGDKAYRALKAPRDWCVTSVILLVVDFFAQTVCERERGFVVVVVAVVAVTGTLIPTLCVLLWRFRHNCRVHFKPTDTHTSTNETNNNKKKKNATIKSKIAVRSAAVGEESDCKK